MFAIFTCYSVEDRIRSVNTLAASEILTTGAELVSRPIPAYFPPRLLLEWPGPAIRHTWYPRNGGVLGFTAYIHADAILPRSVFPNADGEYPPPPSTHQPWANGISYPL